MLKHVAIRTTRPSIGETSFGHGFSGLDALGTLNVQFYKAPFWVRSVQTSPKASKTN